MTRNRVADWTALEREYIYAPISNPVSISDLAEKYDIARSGVARHAQDGKWYERRKEFESKVDQGVTDALAEKWAEIQAAHRERLLRAGSTYLDSWVKKLEAGEVEVNTKDALAVASMMRLEFEAIRDDVTTPTVVSPTDGELSEADARTAIAEIKALMAGKTPEAEDAA